MSIIQELNQRGRTSRRLACGCELNHWSEVERCWQGVSLCRAGMRLLSSTWEEQRMHRKSWDDLDQEVNDTNQTGI